MTPQEYLDWCRDMSERMKKYEYHFTNADRIRNMTDEELSAFLCNMGQECDQCIATDYCSLGHTGMLDWLKKEVKV